MLELLVMPTGGKGRQTGLQAALRDAVASGQLPRGTRLPSTRALAAELGWARATVVGAYEQLVAEGIFVAEPGAGTRVSTAPDPSVPIARVRGPDAPLPRGLPARRARSCVVSPRGVARVRPPRSERGDRRSVRLRRPTWCSRAPSRARLVPGPVASSARPSRPDRHLQRLRRSALDPRRDTSRAGTDDHRRRGSRAPLPSRLLHPRRSRGRASARRRRRAAGRPARRVSPTPCWSPPPTNTRSESRWRPRGRVALVEWARRREDGSSRTTTTASSASTANPSARCRDSIRAESSTAAPRASHSRRGCTSRGSCCRRRSSSP